MVILSGGDISIHLWWQLIPQNEAELSRERSLNELNFLSYGGIATIIVIWMFYCCFCKKTKCWEMWVGGNCCGRTCIRQIVISQSDIKLSDTDLRGRIKFVDGHHRSPNRKFVAVSSEGLLGRNVTLLSCGSGLSFATVYGILARIYLAPTSSSFSHLL
jgi:hypothetical protein